MKRGCVYALFMQEAAVGCGTDEHEEKDETVGGVYIY